MHERDLLSGPSFYQNPIVAKGADPWVILKNGYYWYCYSDGDRSIYVARAERLEAIGQAKPVLVWCAPADGPCGSLIWAPELHEFDGRWYIYFAASDPKEKQPHHRMYVLESLSEHPSGPYQLKARLAAGTDRWAIDGTVLDLGKGGRYLVWSGWDGFENTQQNLYIAALKNPWTLASDSAALQPYPLARDSLEKDKGKLFHDARFLKAADDAVSFKVEVSLSGWYCLELPYTHEHLLPASVICSIDGQAAAHIALPSVGLKNWQSAQKKIWLEAGHHEIRLACGLLSCHVRGLTLSPYGKDRILLSRPTHPWERRGGPPFINEGPQVLQSAKGKKLHLIFSASGSWTDDYTLGRLSLNGPDPLDAEAWQKVGPCFAKTGEVFGPGHASFTQSLDGSEDWILYHSAQSPGSGWKRQINMQVFQWNEEDEPEFGQPVPPHRPLPAPATQRVRRKWQEGA